MKTIIIAAMDRNGIIGRTSKACPNCNAPDVRHLKSILGSLCTICNGTGRVPANDVPWSYPEIDEHVGKMTDGKTVIFDDATWDRRFSHFGRFTTKYVVTARKPRDVPGTGAMVGTFGEVVASSSGWEWDRFIVGPTLYSAALPLADELDLTLIYRDYEGDVKFPSGHLFAAGAGRDGFGRNFHCIERRPGTTPELTFTRWVRR